jgi:hypothetical protein
VPTIVVIGCKSVCCCVLRACRSKACYDPGIRSPTYRILSTSNYLQPTLTQEAQPLTVSTPTVCLLAIQYQTSYLPNTPPHSKKAVGVRVKTNGGDFGIYGRGSSQQPRQDMQLERHAAPSILPEAPLKGNVTFCVQCVASSWDPPKEVYVQNTENVSNETGEI